MATRVLLLVCVMTCAAIAEPRDEAVASAGVVAGDSAIASLRVSRHVWHRWVAGVELAGYSVVPPAMPRAMVVPLQARLSYCLPWRRGELWAGGAAGGAFASYEVGREVVPVESAFAGVSARVGGVRVAFETAYLRANVRVASVGGAVATVGVGVPF